MQILWKGTVSTEFPANGSKLCGNCAFPRNGRTMKKGQITVFYVLESLRKISQNTCFL